MKYEMSPFQEGLLCSGILSLLTFLIVGLLMKG